MLRRLRQWLSPGPAAGTPTGTANGDEPGAETTSSLDSPLAQAKLELGMQLRLQGITDSRVLRAMLDLVPREDFVAAAMLDRAYENVTLPIGMGQTISQPFVVALMTQLLEPGAGKRILEIGTGCGYQAAILSHLFGQVHSIERHKDLAEAARQRLDRLGVTNVSVHLGDGFLGLSEQAPFDGIILTAAPREVPASLVNQLAEGGRLVMPLELENGEQYLMRFTNSKAGLFEERFTEVRFVPMLQGIPDKKGSQTTVIEHESLKIESPKVDSSL